MTTRREFLLMGAGACLAVGVPGFVRAESNRAQSAVGITRVFGDGIKLIAVAVEYAQPLTAESLAQAEFSVQDRTVLGMFVTDGIDGTPKDKGRFVILTLSPDDRNTSLLRKRPPQQKQAETDRGPGYLGEKRESAPSMAKIDLPLTAFGQTLRITQTRNPVTDDFRQFEYADSATGKTVRYNLFVPQGYDEKNRYPLVLFMHDAGVTGSNPKATLIQGRGAISWASPLDQAKHPCFVLAPQFDEIVVDDSSNTTPMLDATINLIKKLLDRYRIDDKRLYVTGQSGGGMMSMAMDIKYPGFFAASYLVACQWDVNLIAPLAGQKLWIVVSEDDDKAYPGQTAIVGRLEEKGAKVARAVWNAKWSPEQFRLAFDDMAAENADINFVAFEKGSVFAEGETQTKGGGHTNTWKFAYNIDPIRDWIFTHINNFRRYA